MILLIILFLCCLCRDSNGCANPETEEEGFLDNYDNESQMEGGPDADYDAREIELQLLPPFLRSALLEEYIEPEFNIPSQYMDEYFDNEILGDPVRTKYGHVYDRPNLVTWMQVRNSDPATNLDLTPEDFSPDEALRTEIEAFITALTKESLTDDPGLLQRVKIWVIKRKDTFEDAEGELLNFYLMLEAIENEKEALKACKSGSDQEDEDDESDKNGNQSTQCDTIDTTRSSIDES